MCVLENDNYSNSSESNDNDNTNNIHNKSQLLGTRRNGDYKHGLKLNKPILKQMIINPHLPPIPPTTHPVLNLPKK